MEDIHLIQSLLIYLVTPLISSRIVRRVLSKVDSSSIDLFSTALLMFVIASMFSSQAEKLYRNSSVFFAIVLPVVVFFLTILLLDLMIAKATKMNYQELALLVFTTTAKNSEVSLAVAATVFSQTLVPLVVAIAPALELLLLIFLLYESDILFGKAN